MELVQHLLLLWPSVSKCQKANHNHCFLRVTDLCSGIETVPWICSCFVCLCMAEEGPDFFLAKCPLSLGGGTNFLGGGIKFWVVKFSHVPLH